MGAQPGPLYRWLEDMRQQLGAIVVSLRFAVHGDGCAEADGAAEEEGFALQAQDFWAALRVGAAARHAEA
jgi:hypothetical protein